VMGSIREVPRAPGLMGRWSDCSSVLSFRGDTQLTFEVMPFVDGF